MKRLIVLVTICISILLSWSDSTAQKRFLWNGHNYKLSKTSEYEFFQNSQYNDMSISEFTNTYCFSDGFSIHSFELLIPEKTEERPVVHFYTMEALKDISVSIEDFAEYKAYWKEAFTSKNYKAMAGALDSLTVCDYIASKSDLQQSSLVYDDERRLSIWYLVNGMVGDEAVTQSVVSNFLFLDGDIIFVKANNVIEEYSAAKEVLKISNEIVSTFLRDNQ